MACLLTNNHGHSFLSRHLEWKQSRSIKPQSKGKGLLGLIEKENEKNEKLGSVVLRQLRQRSTLMRTVVLRTEKLYKFL